MSLASVHTRTNTPTHVQKRTHVQTSMPQPRTQLLGKLTACELSTLSEMFCRIAHRGGGTDSRVASPGACGNCDGRMISCWNKESGPQQGRSSQRRGHTHDRGAVASPTITLMGGGIERPSAANSSTPSHPLSLQKQQRRKILLAILLIINIIWKIVCKSASVRVLLRNGGETQQNSPVPSRGSPRARDFRRDQRPAGRRNQPQASPRCWGGPSAGGCRSPSRGPCAPPPAGRSRLEASVNRRHRGRRPRGEREGVTSHKGGRGGGGARNLRTLILRGIFRKRTAKCRRGNMTRRDRKNKSFRVCMCVHARASSSANHTNNLQRLPCSEHTRMLYTRKINACVHPRTMRS